MSRRYATRRCVIPVLERDIEGDLETPDAYLGLPPELGASYREMLAELRADRGLSWVTDLGDGDLPPFEYAEDLDVPGCPRCGKPFKARLPGIVTEKPRLGRMIRTGDVESGTCPHCGERVRVGTMLLVWRPRRQPRILLSPVPGMTEDQIQQSATVLFELLRRQVGDKFRDEWLSQARVLSRQELAAALGPVPAPDRALPYG
jgi:hypothetical protein